MSLFCSQTKKSNDQEGAKQLISIQLQLENLKKDNDKLKIENDEQQKDIYNLTNKTIELPNKNSNLQKTIQELKSKSLKLVLKLSALKPIVDIVLRSPLGNKTIDHKWNTNFYSTQKCHVSPTV